MIANQHNTYIIIHNTFSVPNCKTADGDTLYQLVLRSGTSLSRISSRVLVNLLSNSREITISDMKHVNPNQETLDGTPFLHALCHSNIEDKKIIELMQFHITENSWNPGSDYLDIEGNTALHIACRANNLALASYLIEQAHCNPNIENKSGSLPLDMTTNLEVIKYLCRHDHVEVYSKTILQWIQSIDHATLLCMLQSLVDNRKPQTQDGSTLLHIACTLCNKKSLVEYLLTKCQCDPNCLDSKGQMPLQLTSDLDIMKTLIEHGAKMTADVVFKMISCRHISETSASELLASSTRKGTMLWSPNDLNSDGDTALHYACKADKIALVRYLLSAAHCDPNVKNTKHEMPIQLTSDLEIMNLLVEYGAKITTHVVFKMISGVCTVGPIVFHH